MICVGLNAAGGGNIGLAGSRTADQHDFLHAIHELTGIWGPDSGLVDLASGKVEAREVLDRRVQALVGQAADNLTNSGG